MPDSARFPLSAAAIDELDRLYRTTRDVRLRTRAQIVLLAGEQDMSFAEIAKIVRTNEQTVRRWLKRYLADGANGLMDGVRPGAPRKVTDAYRAQLVGIAGQEPKHLALPFPEWTARRLVEYMAHQTGIHVTPETVRLHLKAAGICLRQRDPYPTQR